MTAGVTGSQQHDTMLVGNRESFGRMLQSIELLHRSFLDVLSLELGRRDKTLSAVEALILTHVCDKPMSVGELHALGHYEGTSLSYNIGKLAEDGYIALARTQWDKRSILIEITPEGSAVAQIVLQLIDSHAESLAEIGISEADLSLTVRILDGLDNLWSG